MTDPQWTPGRWEAGDNDGESIVIFAYGEDTDGNIWSAEGVHVATVIWPSEDAYDYTGDGADLDEAIRNRAQAWPNAILIQTAPELYEALLALVMAVDDEKLRLPWRAEKAATRLAMNQAIQALVKATSPVE